MKSNFLSIVRNLTLLFLILLIVRGGELGNQGQNK